MANTRQKILGLGLAALLASAFLGIHLHRVPVRLHTVATESLAAEVMGTGTLEARVKTSISSRLQERLMEVCVDQGDLVQEGQLLARLDDAELTRQLEIAEAALASARATAARVRVDEARAQAVEAQARQEHRRVSDLLASRVSAQAEFDKATELLRVAEAERQRAQAATAESLQQVVTAEKTVAYQRERLLFTRILCPYNGLITRRDRDPGSVVVAGTTLLQLASTNEIWVSAWVDETASTDLRPGQPARVVFRSDPARIWQGEVARLGRETDRETREFLVDVKLRELPAHWTLGQRADVFIETRRQTNIVTLPQAFLQWRNGRPGVLAVEHGRVYWREVERGLRGHDRVEVVRGISAGTPVAIPAQPGRTSLQDGQRVRGT